jgi:alpha-L-rhamnosidase
MINKLHQNVVWGMLGNFVSLPTDCPQRDERLGWTGDIQVFAKTANYLYDTQSFLSGWLKDVAAEQKQYDGVPPIFVPWTPPPKDAVNPLGGHKPKAHGVWADVVAITPWDLYNSSGDQTILARQFDSMTLWLEKGLPRLPNGLWNGEKPQYGDWLDPKAPPQYPAHGRTDYLLPANAYLVSTTGLVAKIARILGRAKEAEHYEQEYKRLRQLFRDEYVTKNGRISSDTQTALTLALWFDLVDEDQRQHTVYRLDFQIRWDFFKISTGFAGTPLILPNLAKHGKLDLAYRMLQERDNPSWLYSVGMGATTIVSDLSGIFGYLANSDKSKWERWDSMLPDGSVNPGQSPRHMT